MKTRSVGDAARRLGVTTQSVYAWMASGLLAFELVNGKMRPTTAAIRKMRSSRAVMGKKVPA